MSPTDCRQQMQKLANEILTATKLLGAIHANMSAQLELDGYEHALAPNVADLTDYARRAADIGEALDQAAGATHDAVAAA